jgi:hypothetical protein
MLLLRFVVVQSLENKQMFLDEKKIGEVKVAAEPWRQMLLDAADYIDVHGWCQKQPLNKHGNVCAVGAVYAVDNSLGVLTGKATTGSVMASEALERLRKYTGSSTVWLWNDKPWRTKEEVVFVIRECANQEV